jgi:hypothetical protein
VVASFQAIIVHAIVLGERARAAVVVVGEGGGDKGGEGLEGLEALNRTQRVGREAQRSEVDKRAQRLKARDVVVVEAQLPEHAELLEP